MKKAIGLDAELTFKSQTKTRSSISRRRNPFKVQFLNNSYLSTSTSPSHLDYDLGGSISSLEDVHSEGEESGGTARLVHLPKIPNANLEVECATVGRDPTPNFRDRPPRLPSSESSASQAACRLSQL